MICVESLTHCGRRPAVLRLPLEAQVKNDEDVWESVTAGEAGASAHGDLRLESDAAVLEGQLLVLAVGNGRQVRRWARGWVAGRELLE